MSKYRSIIQVIQESGKAPDLPDGLEPAIKFVEPDFTTYGGFSWWPSQSWDDWISDNRPFRPTTCVVGGLHVARTIRGAQSGGARATDVCLWVGYKPSEAGDWEAGKLKVRRVYVAGPIDLVKVLRWSGKGVDLSDADLSGADLCQADLSGTDLSYTNLSDADLSYTDLSYTNLSDAVLRGTDLSDAYGRNDWKDLVARGAIR